MLSGSHFLHISVGHELRQEFIASPFWNMDGVGYGTTAGAGGEDPLFRKNLGVERPDRARRCLQETGHGYKGEVFFEAHFFHYVERDPGPRWDLYP